MTTGARARRRRLIAQMSETLKIFGGSVVSSETSISSRIRAMSRIDSRCSPFQNASIFASPNGLSIAANISPRMVSNARRSPVSTCGLPGFEFCGCWSSDEWLAGRAIDVRLEVRSAPAPVAPCRVPVVLATLDARRGAEVIGELRELPLRVRLLGFRYRPPLGGQSKIDRQPRGEGGARSANLSLSFSLPIHSIPFQSLRALNGLGGIQERSWNILGMFVDWYASILRFVDALMLPEVLDMQILIPCNLIFDQQPGIQKLLDQGLTVDVVVGERLRLELLGRTVEPAMIVCEVPCGDEE